MGNNNTGIKTSLWPRVFAELGRVAHCERARLVLQLALELRPSLGVAGALAAFSRNRRGTPPPQPLPAVAALDVVDLRERERSIALVTSS